MRQVLFLWLVASPLLELAYLVFVNIFRTGASRGRPYRARTTIILTYS